MQLLLKVVTGDERGRTIVHDVAVAARPDHRVADLVDALGDHVGHPTGRPGDGALFVTGSARRLAPDTPLAASGLVLGDVVTLDPGDPGGPGENDPRAGGLVTVDIVSGPATGRSTTLGCGRHVVGRSADGAVVIDDPTVSRRHLGIEVTGDGTVVVVPVHGVANPARVGSRLVDGPVPVGPDDVVGLGGTRLVVRPVRRTPGPRSADRPALAVNLASSTIDFHRTPYRAVEIPEPDPPTIGPIPTEREPRRFQILSALAPLLAGLTFFAFSRQPHFLVLTALTPLVMIANTIEDRRSGRRRFRRDSEQFEIDVADWRDRIDDLLVAERRVRVAAAPDVADLARRATTRRHDLWERGRSAPDFLSLRVGCATLPSRVRATIPEQGAPDLVRRAREAIVGTDRVDDVPVVVDLATAGVVAVDGPSDLVDGLVSSLVVQAVCLHGPEDLVVAVAVHPDRATARWAKWLPHVRSVTSPLAGDHVVTDRAGADDVVRRLVEIAESRHAAASSAPGRTGVHVGPAVLLVLDSVLRPDAAEVARLLDVGPSVGVHVLWMAHERADVPRQASAVVNVAHAPGAAVTGRMWSADGLHDLDADLGPAADVPIDVEIVVDAVAERTALTLAPIRDASTSSPTTAIPRTAPLLDVLGAEATDPAALARRWARPGGYDLAFPIGVGVDGPVEIDLVADGPHALIGGTSGSGKSELVQSMVASLVARHSPRRLNLLFVDYKGGAASNVFGDLPHTVGTVTNLSAELAERALVSLRAELERRMAVLEGRAKDLAEMLELYPDDAPASLVIVIDEFATLVNEVPDFVAGIVDIAQRGRSLGIHLVLATQRPAGAVNENILANTNIRIALRTLSSADSSSVIDSSDAADIPQPLRGRAYARLGPRHLVGFQSSFGGAALASEVIDDEISVAPFMRPGDEAGGARRRPDPDDGRGATGAPVERRTHLDAVLGAVIEAAQRSHLPEPSRPWREVLPAQLTLDAVLADERCAPARSHPGRVVAVGVLDEPERQDQRPALVDLEAGGGWLVHGSGASGRTTALRTLAVSALETAAPGEVEVVGLDFASRGLLSLDPLPGVVSIATGDDPEAVTRVLASLSGELDRRRELLAAAHADSLSTFLAGSTAAPAPGWDGPSQRVPRVIVLVDDVGGLVSAVAGGSGAGLSHGADAWLAMFESLVIDGRRVGIHLAMTADRRSSVPSRINSAVSSRLVLRHADDAGYADHGIPARRAAGLELGAGRGLWDASTTVQIASVSADPDGAAQGSEIARRAAGAAPHPASSLVPAPLPDVLDLHHLDLHHLDAPDLAAHGDGRGGAVMSPFEVTLGRADLSDRVVRCDLTWSNALVVGPARSGRSTALATLATGLRRTNRVWAVGPMASGFDRSLAHESAFGRGDTVVELLTRLCEVVETEAGAATSHVLVVDDLDVFDDMSTTATWDRVSRLDDLRIVASAEARSLSGFNSNPLLGVLRRVRRLLVLQPDDPTEFLQATGVRSPVRPGQRLPAGRGVLVSDRVPTVVQVARPAAPGSADVGQPVDVVGADGARVQDVFDEALAAIAGEQVL